MTKWGQLVGKEGVVSASLRAQSSVDCSFAENADRFQRSLRTNSLGQVTPQREFQDTAVGEDAAPVVF